MILICAKWRQKSKCVSYTQIGQYKVNHQLSEASSIFTRFKRVTLLIWRFWIDLFGFHFVNILYLLHIMLLLSHNGVSFWAGLQLWVVLRMALSHSDKSLPSAPPFHSYRINWNSNYIANVWNCLLAAIILYIFTAFFHSSSDRMFQTSPS